MDIRVQTGSAAQIEADVLAVTLFEGEQPAGPAAGVDSALGGEIAQLIDEGETKGKLNELTLIHSRGRLAAPRLLVVGLGKAGEFTTDKFRGAAAEAAKKARSLQAAHLALAPYTGDSLDTRLAAQAAVEGAILGTYSFQRHKSKEPEEKELQQFTLLDADAGHALELERGAAVGRAAAEAACVARDLVNEPSNEMTPTALAQRAEALAQEWGLEFSALDREQMAELGMGALLGVAQGSHQPPRFITLRYYGDPGGSREGGVALVGKGITFDSGGISLKPGEGMDRMKGDMSGGASVIAAMRAIAELKPPINVTAVVPATENLPGGSAMKPGDVLRALNGKTIEVLNTDAEGRLILADALSWANKQGLSPLIDVATLTGACSVAIGPYCTGVFSNDEDLAGRLMEAAERAGELMWRLPLYDEFKELIKGDTGDIKNTGGRQGGAITAAKFLQEFAEDTPWVHLDIAPTAMTDKPRTYLPKGATGIPVRTLVNLVLSLAEDRQQGPAS